MRALLVLALALFTGLHARAVLTVSADPYDDACGNGTGFILATAWGGVPPYNYLWSPAPPNGQGTPTASGLFAGTYTVTVTDGNADQAQATVTVNTVASLLPTSLAAFPVTCDGACNGTTTAYINGQQNGHWGGLAPYSVSLSPNMGSATLYANAIGFYNLCAATTYTCTVTDANGCSGSWTFAPQDLVTPVLLNQTINGSCPGGTTGSAVLEYDQMGWVGVTDMGGAWVPHTTAGNQVLLNNVAAGQYTVSLWPINWGILETCGITTVITIPVSANPCGNVQGSVYVDMNADCVQDVSDVPYPNRLIAVQPGNHYDFTNATGQYGLELFYGGYDVAVSNAVNYNTLCPAVVPAPFTLSGLGPTATIDFALESTTGPDLRAALNPGTPRPGESFYYGVTAVNDGAYTFGPFDVTLTFDPSLTYLGSFPAPVVNMPGFLQWSLAGLAPFSSQGVLVDMQVPPDPGLIGTYLTASAAVLPVPADGVPANDTYSTSVMVMGAYDPNDKQALTSSRLSATQYFLDADEHIDYTIRFQNTGNAAATTVELIDTLSSHLDISTLEVLAASHPFSVQLRNDTVLVFRFDNIMLPDSTSDPLGSQGFASFRIAPKASLVLGDVVANNADIYFDFNPPIRTNTVELVADFTTGVMSAQSGARIGVMPNPVSDAAVLSADATLQPQRILLRSTTGQVLRDLSWPRGDAQALLDVSQLATGLYTVEVRGAHGVAVARVVKE